MRCAQMLIVFSSWIYFLVCHSVVLNGTQILFLWKHLLFWSFWHRGCAIFMGLMILLCNCGCAEQVLITYLNSDTFDVSKSSFLKLMPSLLWVHPLSLSLNFLLDLKFLSQGPCWNLCWSCNLSSVLCSFFVMNINYLNLFQAPTPGIALRWGFTRGWLISSAHQMWSSRSPPSPSSQAWRLRWRSAKRNVVASILSFQRIWNATEQDVEFLLSSMRTRCNRGILS